MQPIPCLRIFKILVRFLVTIILGGDSLFTKQRPRHECPVSGRVAATSSSREGATQHVVQVKVDGFRLMNTSNFLNSSCEFC